jgi:excinuclease UvrABC nuclease subunit
MERFYYSCLLKNLNKIPTNTGVFVINDKEKPLFVKSTENLQRFIKVYSDKQTGDKNVQEMIDLIDSISYQESGALIEAFIEELVLIDKYQPCYNNRIKPWYNYIYLGVGFDKPPFLKVCQDTVADYYYIGPFRSSFVLNDILDIFADMFKIPRCENEDYPCERLTNEQCLGFCQNQLGEALPEMLNRLIMVPNKELILKLNTRYEALLNELEFAKADRLSEQISLLKRYYKNLMFAYTSQFISGEFKVGERRVVINKGLIEEIASEDIVINPLHNELDRKNNELLAYDKSEYDHRWIVFDFVYNTEPEMIEGLFMDNIVKMQKKIFAP